MSNNIMYTLVQFSINIIIKICFKKKMINTSHLIPVLIKIIDEYNFA